MLKRNKLSSRYIANHVEDAFTDLGYDYRGNVFRKTLSPLILKNRNNKAILGNIEHMIVFLIDAVKQVRLQFMISLDKNDRNLN